MATRVERIYLDLDQKRVEFRGVFFPLPSVGEAYVVDRKHKDGPRMFLHFAPLLGIGTIEEIIVERTQLNEVKISFNSPR